MPPKKWSKLVTATDVEIDDLVTQVIADEFPDAAVGFAADGIPKWQANIKLTFQRRGWRKVPVIIDAPE